MNRDQTYDLMRGVTILLMMASHLVFNYGLPKQFIYSFHMPLFFIVAGVFAKDIKTMLPFDQYTMKNAKRLLLPYVVTMLMLCLYGCIQALVKHDIGCFLRHFFSMISASADGWNSQWGLIYAGPMWFLVALFLVREIFYGIQNLCANLPKYTDELILGISILLSIIAVYVHPLLPSLPFCILQAFTALAFYAVGWYIHNHPMPWWVYVSCILVWPISIVYGGIDLASSQIKYYPLSFIGACGGTYAIYWLMKQLVSLSERFTWIKKTYRPLLWCGIFSLPILCMHDLEMYSDIYNSIIIRLPFDIERIWGGVLAIVLAYVVTKIPLFNKVYK